MKMVASPKKLAQLEAIISKLPLDVCFETVLPEFGLMWRDVSKALQDSRLPMVPSSVARVLCKSVAGTLDVEEIDQLLVRLRVQLIPTQTRTWHMIELTDPILDEPVRMNGLRGRVIQALKKGKNRGMRPQVATLNEGDLIYLSIQLVSELKQGSLLYVAVPPGEDVALVSSVSMVGLIRACVEGLGYKSYVKANLHGCDIKSLLRIHNNQWNCNADHLSGIPEYDPEPVFTKNGIDYTNKTYDQQYVDALMGPDPPHLTELNIKSSGPFFDATRLNKTISLRVQLKSDDVTTSLKSWVVKGALGVSSDIFTFLHQAKSNNLVYGD